MPPQASRWKRALAPLTSLTSLIFLGIGLGILTGIFLGELARPLELVGTAFVRLLQMTVLPYVLVSLVVGLGQQQPSEARAIARSAGLWLAVLWGIALTAMLSIPIAFPAWESAAFFSSSLIEGREDFDFLSLYIPANPFHALANSLVPAVVVFSMCLGVALIGLPSGRPFLDTLAGASQALTRVAHAVVQLTPVGVFGIAASAAGSISTSQLQQLQVFIAAFVVMALFLTFWVLPGVVAAVTPLERRQTIGVSRDALIAAFATGSVFVVLPLLAEHSKQLMASTGAAAEETDSVVDIVLPASFSFPSAGTLLALSFVLFAGWFTGSPVALRQYFEFALTGLFSAFGGAIVAIPFLLDQMRISADTFDLYLIVSQVMSSRFGALLAAMHILSLSLLCACATTGRVRLNPVRILRCLAGVVLGGLLLLGGTRLLFELGVDREYEQYQQLIEMKIQGPKVPVRSDIELDGPPDTFLEPGGSALDRMLERGSLRVGYFADRLPYAFRNDHNDLVGFDIELAHNLASDLGLEIELIRIQPGHMVEHLEAGTVDHVATGIVVTLERALRVDFSDPYYSASLAFLVEDHLRDEFSDESTLRGAGALKVGVPDISDFRHYMTRHFPEIEQVPMESLRPFLRGERPELSAVLFSAEGGAAWTLVYPDFSVAVPQPRPVSIPMAYPVAAGDARMVNFLNDWLELGRRDGTIDRVRDYWIFGERAGDQEPRWSIIREVLHWVD